MKLGRRTLKLRNNEVLDALCMLLHCSLKDKEFKTQRQQFFIIYSYIRQLEYLEDIKNMSERTKK